MRILDLFSGTHSLANAARPLGHEVVTLDNALPADIDCDFLTWDYTAYPPGHFDLVAASPPCAVWSNARMMNLGKLRLATGRPWTRAELDADIKGPQGEQLIDKLRVVIAYFQPKWYWIENPWLSKMRDYITDLPYVCVDYCQSALPGPAPLAPAFPSDQQLGPLLVALLAPLLVVLFGRCT